MRRIALVSLNYGRLPDFITEEEINEYLASLASNAKTPSRTTFKHTVYGLRSCEAVNLKISDIDFEREMIHIRRSKYNKDRIVPLSKLMAKGLRKYLAVEHPYTWLFNGKEADGRFSVTGLSWVMRETLKKTTIKKEVSLHQRISYNSCRNRHCPKCQAAKQAFWVEDRMKDALAVKYFHVVFTTPHELNALCMTDSAWFYNTNIQHLLESRIRIVLLAQIINTKVSEKCVPFIA